MLCLASCIIRAEAHDFILTTMHQDENAADTSNASGPAASAKARKGKVVPKEASLSEVEDEDEE